MSSISPLLPNLLPLLQQDEPPSPLVQGIVSYGIAGLFTLVGAGCVFLVAFGLPGTWMLLLLAGGLEIFDRFWRSGGGHTFSLWTLGVAAVVALVAEAIEFWAGAAGAKRGGASRRGIVGALLGGIVGAVVGATFLLGVGAIPGGFIGSAVGAIIGELTHPHMTLETSLKPASGAAIGRLAGTLLKIAIAAALWIGLSVAAFVP